MYVQKGGVKFSVVNGSGKEAVVAMFGPSDFFGEGCMAGQMYSDGHGYSHYTHHASGH
jgi:CRP-like cAMP-binding protein